MTKAGLDFAAALSEAQALGYAEADPAADVQGHDAASKLAILAGRMPTASAVLADIVDAAQDIRRGGKGRILAPVRPCVLRPVADTESAFYFCLLVADQPGVLGTVATVLGRHGVSVASMIQRGQRPGCLKDTAVEPVDLVFVTHVTVEHRLRAALAELDAMPQVFKIAQVIRVAG